MAGRGESADTKVDGGFLARVGRFTKRREVVAKLGAEREGASCEGLMLGVWSVEISKFAQPFIYIRLNYRFGDSEDLENPSRR